MIPVAGAAARFETVDPGQDAEVAAEITKVIAGLVAAAQEISVLRALGATDGYIGRPFRWLGWLQGLFAGCVGAALWGGW